MASHGVLLPRSAAALTLRLVLRRAVRPIAARLGASKQRTPTQCTSRQRIPRLSDEAGFGLIEILLAIIFTTVAIMVLVSGFASATVAINRASRISTAGVIADSQMERFRSMTYAWIGLDTGAATDATYKADTACVGGGGCANVSPTVGASDCRAGGSVFAAFPKNCAPTQSTTGPDGRTYRLDTYVRAVQSVAVGNPRATKLVTILVRDPTLNNRVIAREESDFDYCTALPDPSGTGTPC